MNNVVGTCTTHAKEGPGLHEVSPVACTYHNLLHNNVPGSVSGVAC